MKFIKKLYVIVDYEIDIKSEKHPKSKSNFLIESTQRKISEKLSGLGRMPRISELINTKGNSN